MPELNIYDYDVVIVGAGFSGALVAVHLARKNKDLRLLVVVKVGAFVRGVGLCRWAGPAFAQRASGQDERVS